MGVLRKRSPWEREFQEVWRKEQWFLRRYDEKRETVVDRKITEIAPEKLLETLHSAFEKAFKVVFEKGSGLIQKAGRQSARREDYLKKEQAADLDEDRSNLKAFSRSAGRAGAGNVAFSGAAGIGMGLFGIALPDIPLFTAMMLKSVYETAESYGFPCEGEAEQMYALRVIEAALSCGEELKARNRALDLYAQTGIWPNATEWEQQIKATSRQVSEAVLLGKTLQNVPLIGAAGGAGDAVCLGRVQKYAAIKYQKRFLIRRRLREV
jgi:hypothetical protein